MANAIGCHAIIAPGQNVCRNAQIDRHVAGLRCREEAVHPPQDVRDGVKVITPHQFEGMGGHEFQVLYHPFMEGLTDQIRRCKAGNNDWMQSLLDPVPVEEDRSVISLDRSAQPPGGATAQIAVWFPVQSTPLREWFSVSQVQACLENVRDKIVHCGRSRHDIVAPVQQYVA